MSTKFRNLKKFALMSWTCTKCENIAANFKQNYTRKLCIAFKITFPCCFSLGSNLLFQISSKKCFITSTTGITLVFTMLPTFCNFSNRCFLYFEIAVQNDLITRVGQIELQKLCCKSELWIHRLIIHSISLCIISRIRWAMIKFFNAQ